MTHVKPLKMENPIGLLIIENLSISKKKLTTSYNRTRIVLLCIVDLILNYIYCTKLNTELAYHHISRVVSRDGGDIGFFLH